MKSKSKKKNFSIALKEYLSMDNIDDYLNFDKQIFDKFLDEQNYIEYLNLYIEIIKFKTSSHNEKKKYKE